MKNFLKEYGDTLKRKDAHISRMTAYICYKINSPLRSFSWCLRAVNDYLIDEYKGTFDFVVELLPILEEASCNILKVICIPSYAKTENLQKNDILSYLRGSKNTEKELEILEKIKKQDCKKLLCNKVQSDYCPLEKEDQETITANLKKQIYQEF